MKKIKGYITKKELINACFKLDNPQDKFILYALYNGVAGHNNMSDLLNLKVEDVDFKKHIIKLKDKTIKMDTEFEKITKEAIQQDYYYINRNSKFGREGFDLNMSSPYVLKVKITNKTDFGLAPLKYDAFMGRMRKIQLEAGIQETASQIETSGAVNELLTIKKNWTVLDIEFYQRNNNLRFNSNRLYKIIKEVIDNNIEK